MHVRIGTRNSPLARAQTERVRAALARVDPALTMEIFPMTTTGDRVVGALAAHGGKGLFCTELDAALLAGAIDCAVHSLKDIPGVGADGITLTFFERVAAEDVLILRDGVMDAPRIATFDALPRGACVGTSSPRRRWQLLSARPDLRVRELRGNIGTRLQKLSAHEFDAIILANAGVERLGLDVPCAYVLDPRAMIPAIGQGVIAIATRTVDKNIRAMLAPFADEPRDACIRAERALLAAIAGDCYTPLAGHATCDDRATLHLTAWLARDDGTHAARLACEGEMQNADALGVKLANDLRAMVL